MPRVLAVIGALVVGSLAWAGEPDAAKLAGDLVSEDSDVRRAARAGIDALGARAVPALLDAMNAAEDTRPYIDMLFQWNLAPYAGGGAASFKRMLEKQRDNHKLVLLLERIGPGGKPAFPLIESILGDPNRSDFVRTTAAVTLLRGGHPAKPVLAAMTPSSEPSVFGAMTWTEALVIAARDEPKAVERLTALPFVVDDITVNRAFAAVASLGRKGKAAAPRLRALLGSSDPGPRLLAAATLLRIGEDVDTAFRALGKASRAEVHDAVMRFGDALVVAIAPDTIERLAPLLDTPAALRVAHKIAWPLARLGAHAKPAVGPMRCWLSNRSAGEYGLLTLGHVGKDAASERSAFEFLVEKGSDWQRAAAAVCLLRIDPSDKDARAVLDAAAPAVEGGKQRHLARVLSSAAADVPHVAPHLARLVKQGPDDVRAIAVTGFASLGPAGASYVDLVLGALDDLSPRVREQAAFASSRARPDGPASREEAAALAKHLSNPHWIVRAWAAILLSRGPHKRELGPALEPLIRYAASIRPAWRKPADTDFTWEPDFEVALRDAARKLK